MTESISVFVGCDVGDRTSELCVLDWRGQVIETARVRTNEQALAQWFGRCVRSRVVLEVGTHSRWISRLIAKIGHEVIVANPRKVQLISHSMQKSDRRDAELLARLGRFDPRLLGPVTHRGEGAQADLVLVRSRDALVRVRTLLVNHVRGIAKSFGARIPSCDPSTLPKQARELMPAPLLAALECVLSSIEKLTAEMAGCEQRVVQRIREAYPEAARMQQVVGVGPITSAAFVLTLEDPRRFTNSRAVGAYVGLTSARRQSGANDPECRISKAGDPMVRRLLVGCAQHILYRGPDTDLKKWGLTLAARGRKNAKKRAVVAVARKLAVLLHRLWVTGNDYVPNGYAGAPPNAA